MKELLKIFVWLSLKNVLYNKFIDSHFWFIFLSDKLCIAWSGTYESLKQFVSEDLQLKGTWEQPGGDRKLFSCDTSTVLWRKNKCLLSINGENATEIMRELCKRMCNYHANNSQVSASAHTQLSNELSVDVHTDIKDLKLGQQNKGRSNSVSIGLYLVYNFPVTRFGEQKQDWF